MHTKPLLITIILNLTFLSPVFALEDLAGASDHPELPRISGSTLVGFAKTDFGEGAFLTVKDGQITEHYEEGKKTNLVYLARKGLSPDAVLRNYQEVFAELGEVSNVYSCKRKECNKQLGRNFIKPQFKSGKTNLKDLDLIYSSHLFYDDQVYEFVNIKSKSKTYAISIYSTTRRNYSLNRTRNVDVGQNLIHVQIVEHSEFEAELEIVEASEIESTITKQGHIALYGLFFDSGSDVLTGDSKPTLVEIAKVLESKPNLLIYVVGHTDSDGSISSNEDLSLRRAQSVVNSLISDFNINSKRLLPIGVGLAAPVATNKTEAGKALNRRVELVER